MRQGAYLRQRYRAIISSTGLILMFAAAVMLVPLTALWRGPGDAAHLWAFLGPALVMGGVGFVLWRFVRSREPIVLTIQEGGVIVLLSWLTVCFVSAWPILLVEDLTFTQAMFESVSGWTTTGLSVVDVTQASSLTLLWRSTMQLGGGAGFAIIMVAALAGQTGPSLSAAEGRGEQLVPHVRQSAKIVLKIYAGYVLAGIMAYRLAGVDFFDAVNHAFCALSTGGFSTQPDSIGHWDSVAVEAVTIPLMILGNLSFLTAWALLHRRFGRAWRNGELRLFVPVVLIGIAALFFITCRHLYPTMDKSMRVAVFEIISALTTTGYSTVGYGDWNSFGVFVLIMLMIIGGGTCSTAGGLKQFRAFVMFKALWWELRRAVMPRRAVLELSVWSGERKIYVDDQRLREISSFVVLYFAALFLGTAVMTAYGTPIADAFFEYASTLGTVGLSVGVTSADASPVIHWTQIAGMLLGRLEFLVVLVSAFKIVRDAPLLPSKSH